MRIPSTETPTRERDRLQSPRRNFRCTAGNVPLRDDTPSPFACAAGPLRRSANEMTRSTRGRTRRVCVISHRAALQVLSFGGSTPSLRSVDRCHGRQLRGRGTRTRYQSSRPMECHQSPRFFGHRVCAVSVCSRLVSPHHPLLCVLRRRVWSSAPCPNGHGMRSTNAPRVARLCARPAATWRDQVPPRRFTDGRPLSSPPRCAAGVTRVPAFTAHACACLRGLCNCLSWQLGHHLTLVVVPPRGPARRATSPSAAPVWVPHLSAWATWAPLLALLPELRRRAVDAVALMHRAVCGASPGTRRSARSRWFAPRALGGARVLPFGVWPRRRSHLAPSLDCSSPTN